MQRFTSVSAFAILIAAVLCQGSAQAAAPLAAGEVVRQQGTTVAVQIDILRNRPFTQQDTDRVRAEAKARGENEGAAVARARQLDLDRLCNLWVTYLEQMSGNSPQVGVQADTLRCVETADSGKDGTRNARMNVELTVPRGKTVVEERERRMEFRSAGRYDAWANCHRAASSLKNVVVAVCNELPRARADEPYVSALRIFTFARAGR